MAGFVFGAGGSTDVSDTTAVASDVLPGKYFYLADGTKIEGSMPTKTAATLTPSSSADVVIGAGQYLAGAQTLPMDTDFIAGNIKSGVNLWGTVGSFTSDANATADKISNGYTAYVNGVKLTGNMVNAWNVESQTVDVDHDLNVVSYTETVPAGFIPLGILVHNNYSSGTDHIIFAYKISSSVSAPIASGDTLTGYNNNSTSGWVEYGSSIATLTTCSVSGTTLTIYLVSNSGYYFTETVDGSVIVKIWGVY